MVNISVFRSRAVFACIALLTTACSAEDNRSGKELRDSPAQSVSSATGFGNESPAALNQTPGNDDVAVCSPGCALQNDSLGKPIVPDWCEAWSPIAPTCVRSGDKTYCIGMWEGAKISVNELSDVGTVFHLNTDPNERRARSPENDVYFACTRINRSKFSAGTEKNDLKQDMAGAPHSVSCSPGCIFDTQDASQRFENKPLWCLRARNAGCSSNLAASCNEPKPLNLCTQLHPAGKE